jgi:hypothetical protein
MGRGTFRSNGAWVRSIPRSLPDCLVAPGLLLGIRIGLNLDILVVEGTITFKK